MKMVFPLLLLLLSLGTIGSFNTAGASQTYDINTLAGKVASVNNTPGLFIHMSAFVEQEANMSDQATVTGPSDSITPAYVLTSPLDGVSVTSPAVTVNQDTAAAPQNEPAIAVDPNNPNRLVAAANDYITRTWSCSVAGTPCSARGDGYSGTYFSNDGGNTWCCLSTDPSNIGTLIPGVERLVGGPYDAGGDPAVAFDSQGNVFYSGLGFDRVAPPNTVTVSKGTFDTGGNLVWGPPTFIDPTTSPPIFNDKDWIAADAHPSSPFHDRVYVSWTEFIFNPIDGRYVQSPIAFAFSTDGGKTFRESEKVVDNVLYDQGSRIVVAPDGTVYVFWEGSTRLATFNSIYVAKSRDGGVTWSKPVAVASLVDIIRPFNTAFRVNSFPAAEIAPDGTLYVAWTSEVNNAASTYGTDPTCAFFISGVSSVYLSCHAAAVWSSSTDGGATWGTPALIFPTLDASIRTPDGYPVTQPSGGTLNAPAARPVDTFFPAVAISPGHVYMSAYAADIVSPWQRCATPASPPVVGRIDCLTLDNYINNARLDYAVTDLATGVTSTVTTHPINSRYGFGGGFFGDYTGLAVGSDNNFHAFWTDTNNVQTVVWWYGFEFVPTEVHQQDIATNSGNF